MTLDKKSFEYIKSMVNNQESIKSILAFCKGYGMDTESYSSPVHISENKISVRYRRNNYYVSFSNSRLNNTTYFGNI
jgi:hypothetical protein